MYSTINKNAVHIVAALIPPTSSSTRNCGFP